jgi:predicted MPP superfamily phosphohydrolase
MGDLYDFYSFGRFPRSVSFITPRAELEQGREDAVEMWALLRSAAPKAKCFQLLGNHDERIRKQVRSKFPEAEAVLDHLRMDSLWEFDGVKTQKGQADELIIGDVVFQHGHLSRMGDHMRHNHMNTVVGHSHHGGVVTMRYRNKSLWELNVGAVPNMKATPLKYGLNNKLFKSVLGYGLIDEKGPRFIPL